MLAIFTDQSLISCLPYIETRIAACRSRNNTKTIYPGFTRTRPNTLFQSQTAIKFITPKFRPKALKTSDNKKKSSFKNLSKFISLIH